MVTLEISTVIFPPVTGNWLPASATYQNSNWSCQFLVIELCKIQEYPFLLQMKFRESILPVSLLLINSGKPFKSTLSKGFVPSLFKMHTSKRWLASWVALQQVIAHDIVLAAVVQQSSSSHGSCLKKEGSANSVSLAGYKTTITKAKNKQNKKLKQGKALCLYFQKLKEFLSPHTDLIWSCEHILT